jgi:hypothetical protein
VHDLLGNIRIVLQPSSGKPVQSREKSVEEGIECRPIMRQETLDQSPIFEVVCHAAFRLYAG